MGSVAIRTILTKHPKPVDRVANAMDAFCGYLRNGRKRGNVGCEKQSQGAAIDGGCGLWSHDDGSRIPSFSLTLTPTTPHSSLLGPSQSPLATPKTRRWAPAAAFRRMTCCHVGSVSPSLRSTHQSEHVRFSQISYSARGCHRSVGCRETGRRSTSPMNVSS